MNRILLECKNLTKQFEKQNTKHTVLNDINLKIEEGKTTCIHGESGAGKSVLLSILCGIDKPTLGEIYFDDVLLSSLSTAAQTEVRRDKIGVIFQNFNLISYWTALENIQAAIHNHPSNGNYQQPEYFLEALGLSERMNNYPAELSMGEQQRVAVARALIKKPKLIIADEPTGEVDEITSDVITGMLQEYVYKNDATLLVTTHGHFSLNKAERTFELKNGKLKNIN